MWMFASEPLDANRVLRVWGSSDLFPEGASFFSSHCGIPHFVRLYSNGNVLKEVSVVQFDYPP